MKLEAQLTTKNKVQVVATAQEIRRYKMDESKIDSDIEAMDKSIAKFQARKDQLLALKAAVTKARGKKPKFVEPLPAEHAGKDDEPVDITKPLDDSEVETEPVETVPVEVDQPVDEAMKAPKDKKKDK